MRKYIYTAFAYMILSSCVVVAQPYSLGKIEKQLGCKEIQEASDEIEGPLVVHGYSSGSSGETPVSTVLWCQRSEHDFLLVFTRHGNLFHAQCYPYLHWPWYPHGLKLLKASWPISSFTYLNDVLASDKADNEGKKYRGKIRNGPSGVNTTGMIIQDGMSSETFFYCYRGDWMVMQKD